MTINEKKLSGRKLIKSPAPKQADLFKFSEVMTMKLIKLTPKGKARPFSLIQVGTKYTTYSVEIIVADPNAVHGYNINSWAMTVYEDDGGEFITFETTRLKSILGKFYLHELEAMKG